MFKKVVSSVKLAWNNAIEEFEQQEQHQNTSPNSRLSNNENLLNGVSGQQKRLGIKRKAHTRDSSIASQASNSFLKLDLGRQGSNSKRRKFFSKSSQEQSESSEQLEMESNSHGENEIKSNIHDEKTIKDLQTRIHELETLVAQKDNIINILRDQVQSPNNSPSTFSSPSPSLFTMVPATTKSLTPPRPRPLQNGSRFRPMSISQEADAQFDQVIDKQYTDTSFEVLSPIAIDMSKFISTQDPRRSGPSPGHSL